MTKVILEQLISIEDLVLFSNAFKKGKIQVNITKIAKHLGKDRKTIRRYLKGEITKKTKQRIKYLDEHRLYIEKVLSDTHQSFDYIEHLFKYLKRERNITCSRSTLSRYIRGDKKLNELFKRKKTDSFTMRFETKPGEQAQFDMKEKMKLIKNR